MIIEKHDHHKRCVMNSTIIICVLQCMIFVILLFYFFVTALTMRNIVLFFALIAVALAADRCAVTNPIDCGFPGML